MFSAAYYKRLVFLWIHVLSYSLFGPTDTETPKVPTKVPNPDKKILEGNFLSRGLSRCRAFLWLSVCFIFFVTTLYDYHIL